MANVESGSSWSRDETNHECVESARKSDDDWLGHGAMGGWMRIETADRHGDRSTMERNGAFVVEQRCYSRSPVALGVGEGVGVVVGLDVGGIGGVVGVFGLIFKGFNSGYWRVNSCRFV